MIVDGQPDVLVELRSLRPGDAFSTNEEQTWFMIQDPEGYRTMATELSTGMVRVFQEVYDEVTWHRGARFYRGSR